MDPSHIPSTPRYVPTPRKHLGKVIKKRERSSRPPTSRRAAAAAAATAAVTPSAATSTTTNTSASSNSTTATMGDFNCMDFEQLMASLQEDAEANNSGVQQQQTPPQQPPLPPPPPPYAQSTQVNYYIQQQQQHQSSSRHWEPRLLLRQTYRISNQADAVVGLESTRDFKASIYLVGHHTCTSLSLEDLLSFGGICDSVEKYLQNPVTGFEPFYLKTVLLEPCQGGISICNYQPAPLKRGYYTSEMIQQQQYEADSAQIMRQSSSIILSLDGWRSLKRNFGCIESYYAICNECSCCVEYLLSRYVRYFTSHYKTKVILTAHGSTSSSSSSSSLVGSVLNPDLIAHINGDLPIMLRSLNETRLPSEARQDYWYESSPLRSTLLPWIDSEFRRFCVPNILDAVLSGLKYVSHL